MAAVERRIHERQNHDDQPRDHRDGCYSATNKHKVWMRRTSFTPYALEFRIFGPKTISSHPAVGRHGLSRRRQSRERAILIEMPLGVVRRFAILPSREPKRRFFAQ